MTGRSAKFKVRFIVLKESSDTMCAAAAVVSKYSNVCISGVWIVRFVEKSR